MLRIFFVLECACGRLAVRYPVIKRKLAGSKV